ncbi:MAG: EamA family transporter [Bacilli bacterium]|nr:EamA family transporter [Bacilli bacterium]
MTWILFAVLALFSSVGNTIFNRISSHKIGSLLSACIKSFLITIACLLICICFGHIKDLYSVNKIEWMWVGVLGLITIIDWLFYFLALKRSHLEAFAPFEVSAILFFSNLLFSIFMISIVTSGATPLKIVFYYAGLGLVSISMFYAVFNKKINPIAKLSWVIFSLISALALSFTFLIVKLKLSHIHSDVIAFHQMLVVFVVCLIAVIFSKERHKIKEINGKTYLNFFISAVFNACLMVFRYMALASANAIPSIITIIVSLDFVFVSIATVLFFKADNKKQLVVLIIITVSGMILNALPALI